VLVAWDGVLDVVHAGRLTAEDGSDLTDRWTRGEPIPFGYHELCTGDHRAVVISAPIRLPEPAGRRLCVFAPLFALRPATADRPADLRELEELVDWAAACGATGVLTLPLLAGFLDPPCEPSPYAPASRWMWNDLYAVVDRPPIDTSAAIVDYAAAAASTVAGIEAEVRRLDTDDRAAGAFARFLDEHPEVAGYARFRAACDRHGRDWRHWPEPLCNGTVPDHAVDPARVRRHAVGQWLVHTRLVDLAERARARGVALGLDLAIGTHPLAYDVWVDQQAFARGASVGAPPDRYFPGGQTWGFPPPVPDAVRRCGHIQLRRALRHHLRIATLLRIDHVLGLSRLFWVPDGATPAEGTYVHAPLDEQLAVVCLEAWRAGATIVGENLGLVPPEIDAALARHGLLGMHVAYGTLEDPAVAAAPLTAHAHDLASFGTHDMPTFAGFVAEQDLDDRIDLGFGEPADAERDRARRRAGIAAAAAARQVAADAPALFDALSVELGTTEAPWVVLALDDLFDETGPVNVPGTSDERPNWVRRMRHPLASAPASAADRLRNVAAARTRSCAPKTTMSPKGPRP
jgi:4-alpha-glucanotransferase